MKLLKTVPLLLIFMTVLTTVNSFAQIEELTKEDMQDIIQRNVVPEFRSVDIKGSPYYNDTFKDGFVTLFNNSKTETLSMNYNIYENRIEYTDGNTILAINGSQIKEFTFTENGINQTFRKGFSASGLDANEFVHVLVDGNAKLLIKNEVSYQQDISSYGVATQQDEYISNQRIYFHIDGETDRVRRMRERSVIRSFNQHRDRLEKYTAQNNLDLSELNDVKRLLEYYNSIN